MKEVEEGGGRGRTVDRALDGYEYFEPRGGSRSHVSRLMAKSRNRRQNEGRFRFTFIFACARESESPDPLTRTFFFYSTLR